ncbi:MAG: hypothetical protein JWR36_917 [Glaciihabitans sp.]|jgi:hypothetical protein|nr:hypothetical protein [Glaciihabitans sp.]MDQ1570321.1 hypothetical protein [Actinomycetota bacterium]
MIEWANFLLVLVSSIVAGCGVVLLFSLGLRFAGPATTGRKRVFGVALFVLCGLLIAYGVYLIIPFLH